MRTVWINLPPHEELTHSRANVTIADINQSMGKDLVEALQKKGLR